MSTILHIKLSRASTLAIVATANNIATIPADAEVTADHVTLAYGALNVRNWDGPRGDRKLQLTHYGSIDGKVAAFKVDGAADSLSATPHVTVWVVPPAKSMLTNEITQGWIPLPYPISIEGVVEKVVTPPRASRSETRLALEVSKKAHAGQVRSMGEDLGIDYFTAHIVPVVKRCPEWARPAAALHDTVEDTEFTHRHLADCQTGVRRWFSKVTLDAVELLTKGDDAPYENYITAIIEMDGDAGMIARAVKFADLCDNLATTPPELRSKYTAALARIATSITERGEAGL